MYARMATIKQIGAMCNMKVENVTPDAIILASSLKAYGLHYHMDQCNIEVKKTNKSKYVS